MSLSLLEIGTPGAPTIVFLHGAGAAGWMWRPQLAAFADYHCLVPDLPGHGGSNQVPWGALGDVAAQLVELIRQRASGGRAHIVGLSLGAYLAAQILNDAPEVVERAVLSGLCVLPLPYPRLMRVMGAVMAPLMKTGPVLRANAKALRLPPELFEAYATTMRTMSPQSFKQASADAGAFRMPANLGQAMCPTLVVAGAREHRLIIESTRLVAEALPAGVARLAPQVGHGWSGENPALFNQTVSAWLASAPLPAALLPLPSPVLAPA